MYLYSVCRIVDVIFVEKYIILNLESCDSVSMMCGIGKKKDINLQQMKSNIYSNPNSSLLIVMVEKVKVPWKTGEVLQFLT